MCDHMKKENLAMLEMLLCATLWSIAGIFIKLIPWNGFAVASMRSLVAGLTIALYMLITKKRFVTHVEKPLFLKKVLTKNMHYKQRSPHPSGSARRP